MGRARSAESEMWAVVEGSPSHHVNIFHFQKLGILNGTDTWKSNDAKYINLQLRILESQSFCSRNQTSHFVREGKVT